MTPSDKRVLLDVRRSKVSDDGGLLPAPDFPPAATALAESQPAGSKERIALPRRLCVLIGVHVMLVLSPFLLSMASGLLGYGYATGLALLQILVVWVIVAQLCLLPMLAGLASAGLVDMLWQIALGVALPFGLLVMQLSLILLSMGASTMFSQVGWRIYMSYGTASVWFPLAELAVIILYIGAFLTVPLVVAAVYCLFEAAVFRQLRKRVTELRRFPERNSRPIVRGVQFSLRHVLQATFLAGVSFALIRVAHSMPDDFTTAQAGLAIVANILTVFVALAAFSVAMAYATLGCGTRWLRLAQALLGFIARAALVLSLVKYPGVEWSSFVFYVTALVLFAAVIDTVVIGSLLVVRSLGYRLVAKSYLASLA